MLRRFFRSDDLIAQILALGIVINMVAYLASAMPTTYWSVREIAGVLPAGAVLAGRELGSRMLTARLMSAVAVVLAGYLAALGYTAAQPPVPAATQDLADWLTAHHLSYGLSSYGLANTTTLASGGAVDVRSVSWYKDDTVPGTEEFNRTWYDPRSHDANFVVLINPAVPADPTAGWDVRAAFGPPARTYHFGRYIIMTYTTNLLTDLGPGLPRAAAS